MKNFITKVFDFSGKYQMQIQALILWIVAITHIGSNTFWYFAIPAIIISGLGDIIGELRKLNKEESNGKH